MRYLIVVIAGVMLGAVLIHFAVNVHSQVVAKGCERGAIATLAKYAKGDTARIDAAVESAVTGKSPPPAICAK